MRFNVRRNSLAVGRLCILKQIWIALLSDRLIAEQRNANTRGQHEGNFAIHLGVLEATQME
jgi:hypothetical protein